MITTLCYIEKHEKYLMLHRTKKEKDVNAGKWIGVGGKLEEGENLSQCLVREIKEETGLSAEKYRFRGIVVFHFNEDAPLYMYLYTCHAFSGELQECKEGELKWIEKKDLFQLNLWEGDKIFLPLIQEERPLFYLTLHYNDDVLLQHHLEFKEEFNEEEDPMKNRY